MSYTAHHNKTPRQARLTEQRRTNNTAKLYQLREGLLSGTGLLRSLCRLSFYGLVLHAERRHCSQLDPLKQDTLQSIKSKAQRQVGML